MNKGYILLLAPRPAAQGGAAAGGYLLRCRSSTMTPHRLRRGASHLPARRSRQNATFIHYQALTTKYTKLTKDLRVFRG
ncbi:MAG: hypothetical protein ABSC60_05820 [Acidobacteriota bacterium]|jgi:hypothetical protein